MTEERIIERLHRKEGRVREPARDGEAHRAWQAQEAVGVW